MAANLCRSLISTLRPGEVKGFSQFQAILEATYKKDIDKFYEVHVQ